MLNDKRLSFVNRTELSLGVTVSCVEFLDYAQLLTGALRDFILHLMLYCRKERVL